MTLAFDVPTLQLIAYSALTFASITVASVSAVFGYHQNFGWKPIILPTGHGIGRLKDHDEAGPLKATLEFEVWNRRKYPIVLNGAQVDFESLNFVTNEFGTLSDEEMWNWGGRTFWNPYSERIEPGSHYTCKLGAACQKQHTEEIHDRVRIQVDYWDPNWNRYLSIKATHIFEFDRVKRPRGWSRIWGFLRHR